MKKYFLYALMLCAFIGCKDNSGLYGLLADMDNRITEVEKQCDQLNTNIDALQALVEAQQTGDYITAIIPIKEGDVEIGYTITFAHHSPITIYHGKNGQDGQDGTNGTNGTNGTDGHTPVIGVAQDTDGVYYWTLDGEWMLDANNNKIRVTGQDGKDGVDGQDGQDGQDGTNGTNGTNGTDGITPQLKIENDYWYISYDNGVTWTQLGKAKGDKGDKGDDGATGGSIFTYILTQGDYVYFYLTDGTVIRIPIVQGTHDNFVISISLNKTKDTLAIGEVDTLIATVIPYDTTTVHWTSNNTAVATVDENGIITAINTGTATITVQALDKKATCVLQVVYTGAYFSVAANRAVVFSPGNLQYQASTDTWRFAEHQTEYIGIGNNNISATYTGWIDFFAWGTSGWDSGAECYQPWSTKNNVSSYTNATALGNSDWGVYNNDKIINNYNTLPETWRTPTGEEWSYLINTRNENLYAWATINNVKGLMFLPDNWVLPTGLTFNPSDKDGTINIYSLSEWGVMESAGAVFLPSAGQYDTYSYHSLRDVGINGYYWSSNRKTSQGAYRLIFVANSSANSYVIAVNTEYYVQQRNSVRLIKTVKIK